MTSVYDRLPLRSFLKQEPISIALHHHVVTTVSICYQYKHTHVLYVTPVCRSTCFFSFVLTQEHDVVKDIVEVFRWRLDKSNAFPSNLLE